MVMDCLSSSGCWSQSPSVVMQALQSSGVERGKLQKLTSDDLTVLVLLAVGIQDTRGRMCVLRQGLRLHWTSKMHGEPLQRL